MEEVPDSKPKPKLPKVPIDLSRVGVSVDPNGKIVPIKDSPDDSWAGTGVKPFVNQIENTFQPLPFAYPYGPFGGSPYRFLQPNGGSGYAAGPISPLVYGALNGYNPYNINPYAANPNLAGTAYGGYGYPGYGYGNPGYGYPGYGLGYPGYGYGYPGYGYGYPAPLATFNIGKFQGAIGSVPGIYPNAVNSIFIPPTTTYSQTSMWRAFNLAF